MMLFLRQLTFRWRFDGRVRVAAVMRVTGLIGACVMALALADPARAHARLPPGATPPSVPEVPMPSAPAHSGHDPAMPAFGAGPVGAYDGALVPPHVEEAPYAGQAGGYCYVGPHPVDTRVVPGPSWDATEGAHTRSYAPVDLRLFTLRDGCYYFTGDPRDFGYGGPTFAYYGAHPVLNTSGGGWCFMMGGHTHLWRPWSPYFTMVGAWNHWRGPYDPFFWTYWPYYAAYYRSYYPHFYGGGRFYRGGGHHVAPPIGGVVGGGRHGWRGGDRVSFPGGAPVPAPVPVAPGPATGMPGSIPPGLPPSQIFPQGRSLEGGVTRGMPPPQMYSPRGAGPEGTRPQPPPFAPGHRPHGPSNGGGFGPRGSGSFRGGGDRH